MPAGTDKEKSEANVAESETLASLFYRKYAYIKIKENIRALPW